MRIEDSIRTEIEDLLNAIQQCALGVSELDPENEALLESIHGDADRIQELMNFPRLTNRYPV